MRTIYLFPVGVSFLALRLVAQDAAGSLTGKVMDSTGAVIVNARVDLRGERQNSGLQAQSDSFGVFRFLGLEEDNYALKLFSPGFSSLTVKSVHILKREAKSMPDLELAVATMGDCGAGHAVLEFIRFRQPKGHDGDLGGSVRVDKGPLERNSPPVIAAEVDLICGKSMPCGSTQTDSYGQFIFKALPPGDYSVQIDAAGYYPLKEPGYKVAEGLESVYWSVAVERCANGNCDPSQRPKKPVIFVCE